ncbi:MAG TPA: hypothetical protein VGN57_16720 [Pirellulaceae bacterium]|jgi:hypothetical protein|nr:hypothetical protein [Pirellulaceae bacterium]
MKKAVDFLPAGYRAQRRRRGLPWSVFLVAGAVALGIVSGAIGQRLYGRAIAASMDEALAQKALVDADLARLAELRAERDRLEALVRRTYLTHRPAHLPSFFAELSRSLPENCRMLEVLRLDAEQARSTPTYAPPAPGAAASPAAGDLSAIDRDRERLRRTSAFAETETWIASGVSTDVASLHQFVEMLERSSLGLSAQLTSFEAARGQAETVRFSLTIQRNRSLPIVSPTPAATAKAALPPRVPAQASQAKTKLATSQTQRFEEAPQ